MDSPLAEPRRKWTLKRFLCPEAFVFFSILVLFSAAYYLSSDLNLLPGSMVAGRTLSESKASTKFGEFSSNGEDYKSISALIGRGNPKDPNLAFRSTVGLKRLASGRPKAAGSRENNVLKALFGAVSKKAGKGAGENKGGLSPAVFHTLADSSPDLVGGQFDWEGDENRTALELSQADGLPDKIVIRPQGNDRSKMQKKRVASLVGASVGGEFEAPGRMKPGSANQGKEAGNLTREKDTTGLMGLREQKRVLQKRPKSTAECVRDSDGSDICHYGGVVCYDGGSGKLVLIDDDKKGQSFESAIAFQDGRWTQGRLPPESKWPLPINNKIEGVWEGHVALANATFLDGGLWIVRPETDNTNHIWHNGLSFTGLLQAHLRNSSGVFPPQDHVLVLNRTAENAGYTDYNLGMLQIVSQPQTKLIFTKDLPQETRLLCANRGAITSYKPSWSAGPLDAAELRARAYKTLAVTAVDKANWKQVTIVNRPFGFPRHVENVNALLGVVKKLGLEVNLVQEVAGQSRSFREQVLTMSQTGILIAPHGGGLANLAWLPENAAVIELFPNKCVQTEYRNMAAARNLVYFGVEAVNYTHPQMLLEFSPQEIARCQGLHSIDHSHDGTCNQMIKNYPFKVPLEDFERTLRYALEHFFTIRVPFPLQKRMH